MDPTLLAPLVPRGTVLDSWRDTTYASIVGFRFQRTRLLGIPIPFHQDFAEVNLRFYVRRTAGTDERRGVVFIREIVPRRAVAALARWIYNEPYGVLPMRSAVTSGAGLAVQYEWHLARTWHRLTAETTRPLTLPAADSLEQFIVEHYWGYTRQRDGSTIEYQVTHPPWTVAPAGSWHLDADLAALYGRPMSASLEQPVSVFLANGSAVAIFTPSALPLEQ